MTELAHTVHNSLIDKERTFTLGADALHWRDAAGEGQIAYADVSDMRLIGYTSLIGEAFQCTLRARGGGKVKIRSAHYRNLGNFEGPHGNLHAVRQGARQMHRGAGARRQVHRRQHRVVGRLARPRACYARSS
jgi:hypothetical protein